MNPAAADTLLKNRGVDVQVQDLVDGLAGFFEGNVESFCLCNRAGETVEQKTVLAFVRPCEYKNQNLTKSFT